MTHPRRSVLSWGWSSLQPIDQPKDSLKHEPRHRGFGDLEDDVAAMAHGFGADLCQRLPEAGQRPLLERLGSRRPPHEVGEIVGQRLKNRVWRLFIRSGTPRV